MKTPCCEMEKIVLGKRPNQCFPHMQWWLTFKFIVKNIVSSTWNVWSIFLTTNDHVWSFIYTISSFTKMKEKFTLINFTPIGRCGWTQVKMGWSKTRNSQKGWAKIGKSQNGDKLKWGWSKLWIKVVLNYRHMQQT